MTFVHIRRRDDDGAVLVLALIVLMVFGLILGALFNQTSASQNSTPFVRAHLDNVYAADAGIDAAIQQLHRSSNYCATTGNPSADLSLMGLANGHDVSVRCRVLGTRNTVVGAGGYAAIVLAKTGNSISTTQGASTKVIDGPVFVSGDSDLKQPLTVHNGDIDNLCYHAGPPSSGAVKPTSSSLKFDEGYSWTGCTESQPDADHILEQELCTAAPGACKPNPAGYLSVGGVCRLFLPGTYTTAPTLDTTKINYFLSGTYHFSSGVGGWPIKSAAVVAGRQVNPPSNAADCTKTDPTTIGTGALVSSLPGGGLVSGYGATFVFSGNSYIDMQSGGSLEVFARLRAAGDPGTWTERLSIVALRAETPDPDPTWPKSSITTDVLVPKNGNTPAETIHGVYYTPKSSLTVTATNGAIAQFLGGLVVDNLTIAESASAISLQIGVQQTAADRVVLMTSTSTPTSGEKKSVTASAVATVSSSPGFPVTVTSWRSSAPDF